MRDLTGVTCIGYARVSTERQAGEDKTSIAQQQKAIEQRAKALGLTVGAWFIDAGASGGTAARPQFKAMRDACDAAPRREPHFGTVLVLNSSRFGRFDNPEQSAYWRVWLEMRGWLVRFVENDDTEDRTTRTLMRAIADTAASKYRADVKVRAKSGAKSTTEQGFWRCEAPYGFRRKVVTPAGRERVLDLGVPKAPDERVKLTPHAEEAKIVRGVFERSAHGESLGEIVRWLNQKAPRRPWSRRLVQAILKNETYLGHIPGGRRRSIGVDSESGRAVLVKTTPDEWYTFRNAHPALVSPDLFDAVQARLAENRKMFRGGSGNYALSGLVVCSVCGQPYVGGGVGNTIHPTPQCPDGRSWFYRCRSAANDPPYRRPCRGHAGVISKHILEGAVLGEIAKVLIEPKMVRLRWEELDRALTEAEKPDKPVDVKAAKARITKLTQRRDRVVASIADGVLTRDEAASKLDAIRTELATLQRVTRPQKPERRRTLHPKLRAEVTRLVSDFAALARESKGRDLRELIRPWLAGAVFDKTTRRLALDIKLVPDGCTLSGQPARD